MALPIIVSPEFTTKLPSSDTEIKFRPFLVKEEKLLLFAAESGERNEMIDAVCQMMRNCVITPGDFEPNNIPYFDFEHLLLHIRSKSVGETAQFMLKHDKEECGHQNKVSTRLDNIIYKTNDDHKDKIQLNDELGVKMRYPTIAGISKIDENNTSELLDVIVNNIEYVYDKEEVYNDFSKEEANTFLESLSKEQFAKLSEFFNTMPVSRIEVKYECEKCKENVVTLVSGFESFFS